MKRQNSALFLLAALAAHAAAPLSAFAADDGQQYRTLPPGEISCASWARGRDAAGRDNTVLLTPDGVARAEREGWVLGYMTALNAELLPTDRGVRRDVTAGYERADVMALIDVYCGRNPLHAVIDAARAVAAELSRSWLASNPPRVALAEPEPQAPLAVPLADTPNEAPAMETGAIEPLREAAPPVEPPTEIAQAPPALRPASPPDPPQLETPPLDTVEAVPPPAQSQASAGMVWQRPAVTPVQAAVPAIPPQPPASPLPATPPPGNPAPATSAPPPPLGTAGSGAFVVQIGAYRTVALAQEAWQNFLARFSDIIADYTYDIEAADLGPRGTWHRVRIGPFADEAGADAICTRIALSGGECFATMP